MPETTADTLPLAGRKDEDMPGHWLLARMGKRVLRPGGKELTRHLLADAALAGADVVELAPGLGKTATEILEHSPRSYVGIEADPQAVALTEQAIVGRGTVRHADADATGLDDASADAVVGEAMLTMQTERGKSAIIDEAFRVLRPGGRYAVHELSLHPDTLSDDAKTEIRKALARSIKVNARPLTEVEWRELFEKAGFEVEQVRFAPMALLETRRMIADEGIVGTLKIGYNIARNAAARKRILDMRSVFIRYRDQMSAIEVIVRKPRVAE
ncbi:class I SAM-dependent methyltransferase [Gordonia phthalatica]|uniref:Methyltransferase n=1 Tax=Gordonia phthalatica TaxID=1136941 RepID=A0A0N9N8Y7_9ACTN|nr:class I SAM-dependent methyltransferase [Gordonia phthalatica]ALG83602.1 methyltransferase [Gordonia phthalatica]